MKYLLYPHAGCDNHGCEAIVRSTVALLDLKKKDIMLYTSNHNSDFEFELDKIVDIANNESNSKRINKVHRKMFAINEHFFGGDRDCEELSYRHKKIVNCRRNIIAMSIGGDNYCYPGMQHVLSEYSKLFAYNKVQSVLWGCSLEEKLLSPKVIGELKNYSLITARESITYNILKRLDLQLKIVQCADPAFTLATEVNDTYDYFFKIASVIGINVSPLNNRFDAYDGATISNYINLVKYILANTKYNILFIPHVRAVGNDDITSINGLIHALNLNDNKRIRVVTEKLNCMQLKYIISKCNMFIGCRTHATIAAYSTCVPTLVVGYSTKAKGIYKDLFGNNQDLLVDAREFETNNDLTKMFMSFIERKDNLKQHLENIMPQYIDRAYVAKNALLELQL